MKTFKVYTLKLARDLTDQGFKIVDVIPNKQKPWLNVFCFEDSTELRNAIAERVNR